MKKVLKFGCLSVLALFVLIFVFIVFSSDATGVAKETDVLKAYDSLELVKERIFDQEKIEQNRIKDSLRLVEKESAINELKNFRKAIDDFNEITFYQDNRTPAYANRNFIYPYIGEKYGSYWMKLKFQYTADDWLFIDEVRIKTDSNDYTINGRFERDNNSEIWEWYHLKVGEEEMNMLEDIVNSEVAKVRYNGSQYYKDRTLTTREKDIIRKTLDIYKRLN